MESARLVQVAMGIVLCTALLVETAALFDEDLGTPVPVFHEWTCRGALAVAATDGFGRPSLRVPNTGLNASATWDGELVPAYFMAFTREPGLEWVELPPTRDDRGWHIFFLETVTPATEAYVKARDISGLRCEGQSAIIRAAAPTPASA